MFLGKDEHGDYILDPNETPVSEGELRRASELLTMWHAGHRKAGEPTPGQCPHEDHACRSERECLGKIAWWRRYVMEIEACDTGNA